MHGLEAVPGDVRVDLRGGNIGVAEKFLYDAQVRAPLQEVRCKRMPERVRRNRFSDTGEPRVFFDQLPNVLTRQPSPVSAEKKVICFGFHL
jgi:hypothetical protein